MLFLLIYTVQNEILPQEPQPIEFTVGLAFSWDDHGRARWKTGYSLQLQNSGGCVMFSVMCNALSEF